MNIPGQSGGSYSIPGASGYTTKAPPKAFTVEETQALLREWGKKIGFSDEVIKGAAVDDAERVYKKLFASLSSDLSKSGKAANAAGQLDDQRAIQALIKGRNDVKKGFDTYNDAVAQGVPKWLQGKNINEVTFEDLMSTYKGLNPDNRAVFRDYIKDIEPEALKRIDSTVYEDFIGSARKRLDDGSYGVDLEKLALNWKELSKDKTQLDAIAQSLGTNASEFEKRMKLMDRVIKVEDIASNERIAELQNINKSMKMQ